MEMAFKKVIDEFGDEMLVIFQQGHYQQPLAIFDRFDIANLRKELKNFKI